MQYPFGFNLKSAPGNGTHVSLLSLTLGLAGLGNHIPSIFRMLSSRARFSWEAMSRGMRYAKTCPGASEGIAGKLDSLSSLQSGSSSSPAPVRRNSKNGWRVCKMSCPVPCRPSTSSVRSRAGRGRGAWGFFWVRAEKDSFTVVPEGSCPYFLPEKSTRIAHYCQKVPCAPSSSMQLSS